MISFSAILSLGVLGGFGFNAAGGGDVSPETKSWAAGRPHN
jgi:hypothetical protein